MRAGKRPRRSLRAALDRLSELDGPDVASKRARADSNAAVRKWRPRQDELTTLSLSRVVMSSRPPATSTARLDAMVAEATVDCYNEDEQVTGLFTMIEDNLALPFQDDRAGGGRLGRPAGPERQRADRVYLLSRWASTGHPHPRSAHADANASGCRMDRGVSSLARLTGADAISHADDARLTQTPDPPHPPRLRLRLRLRQRGRLARLTDQDTVSEMGRKLAAVGLPMVAADHRAILKAKALQSETGPRRARRRLGSRVGRHALVPTAAYDASQK